MHRSLRAPAVFVALIGCQPDPGTATDTATTTSSSTLSSTSSSTTGASTEPTSTTGDPPNLCDCLDPQVVNDNLDVAGLAQFAGACIGEVRGRLTISGVTDPAVLQPLAGLRRVHDLQVSDNPGLADLSALACLEEVTDYLEIQRNPALVDLGALARLRIARFVSFRELPIAALPSFAPDYHGARTLALEALPGLVDLDPLAAWPSVVPESGAVAVEIRDVPKLQSVAGLAGPLGEPMPDTWMYIELIDLPALPSITGLEAFRDGNLTLAHLPQVTSLAPLAATERVETLRLLALPGLSSLDGLHNLATAVDVQLGGCGEHEGLDALTDLSGLDALTEVHLLLSIVGNAGLVALTGAPLLTAAGRVEAVDNPLLTADAVAAFAAQVETAGVCLGGPIACGCSRQIPEPAQHGCPSMWSGGSAVTAEGPGGPLAGATAFFGWNWYSYYPDLHLVVVDAGADVDVAKQDGIWHESEASAPKLRVETSIEYPEWFGEHSVDARLIQPGSPALEVPVHFTVSGRLGDWTMSDPADPPRLVGEFTSDDPNAATIVQGPFDAVFCDRFTWVASD